MGLSAYHGYARNKSVGWGIGWGVAGAVAPIITVPIALAQGYAKPARSSLQENPGKAFVEVGTIEHEGQQYTAGGAYYDPERGLLAGYPMGDPSQGYGLYTWKGELITPLRLVSTYRGGFGRNKMYSWQATYNGQRFSGRNSGLHMALRMRAKQ